MSTFPTLTTERLVLRQLSKNDAAAILQLRSDLEVNKYLDRKLSKTLEDALAFIANIVDNSDALYYWAITKTGENNLMGTICLFDIADGKCEIGYELLTEFQGKGIMLEAAKKVIEYAHQTLGLTIVDAVTHNENQGSAQLLQRLGFQQMRDTIEENPNLILFRLNI